MSAHFGIDPPKPTIHSQQWSPPPAHLVKYNCDGSFKDGKASIGVLGRNNIGTIIDGHGCLVKASSPLHAEVLAIREGCSLAYQRNFHSAYIESDSLVAISLASSDTTPPWHVAAVVEDIRIIASRLNLKFYFIPRFCNAPAHWIAKKALHSALPLDWICCPPCDLSSLMRCDLL